MRKNALSYRLLSRRNLLKNAALMTILAPVLRATDARGDGPTAPRRVILVFQPNGPMVATGPASGSETDFTLHDWWKPLEAHKTDGIFLSNLATTGASVVPGNGHGLGGQLFSGYGVLPDDQYASAGPTIDQTIGKHLEANGAAGKVRSVVWGLGGGGYTWWAGPGLDVLPETDPSKAWAGLFSGPDPNDAAALLRQKSILDVVSQDCEALRNALGKEGMERLDDHCTTLRQMEKAAGTSLSCSTPTDPGENDWTNPENIDAQMAAFTDLMALTLVCEATHVIAFQFGSQGARLRLASDYGVPSSGVVDSGDSGPAHHPWTHNSLTQGDTVEAMRIFQTFYSTKLAMLIDKLKTTVDASGSPLLDSTVVLSLSELGGTEANDYQGHITSAVPGILFGSGQGTFNTGRYIQGPSSGVSNPGDADGGRMTAELLVSVMQYMGLDVTTVGETGVSGPLDLLY
jgi:hypothetical protein